MAGRKFALVDKKHCVACGTCIAACPKQAIAVIRGCYAQVDGALCVGCGKCARVCPANCISTAERQAEA